MSYGLAFTGITVIPYLVVGGIMLGSGVIAKIISRWKQ